MINTQVAKWLVIRLACFFPAQQILKVIASLQTALSSLHVLYDVMRQQCRLCNTQQFFFPGPTSLFSLRISSLSMLDILTLAPVIIAHKNFYTSALKSEVHLQYFFSIIQKSKIMMADNVTKVSNICLKISQLIFFI